MPQISEISWTYKSFLMTLILIFFFTSMGYQMLKSKTFITNVKINYFNVMK